MNNIEYYLSQRLGIIKRETFRKFYPPFPDKL